MRLRAIGEEARTAVAFGTRAGRTEGPRRSAQVAADLRRGRSSEAMLRGERRHRRAQAMARGGSGAGPAFGAASRPSSGPRSGSKRSPLASKQAAQGESHPPSRGGQAGLHLRWMPRGRKVPVLRIRVVMLHDGSGRLRRSHGPRVRRRRPDRRSPRAPVVTARPTVRYRPHQPDRAWARPVRALRWSGTGGACGSLPPVGLAAIPGARRGSRARRVA